MSEVIVSRRRESPIAIGCFNARRIRPRRDAGRGGRIDVRCNAEGGGCGRVVYERAEDAVMAIGDAFIPVKHDGVIYIRPPVG